MYASLLNILYCSRMIIILKSQSNQPNNNQNYLKVKDLKDKVKMLNNYSEVENQTKISPKIS